MPPSCDDLRPLRGSVESTRLAVARFGDTAAERANTPRAQVREAWESARKLARHIAASLLVTVAVLMISPAAAVGQPSTDPASLVGIWSGRWAVHTYQGPRSGGQCYITIERVEADVVYAVMERFGLGTMKRRFKGILEGDRIAVLGERMEFIVTGDSMKGTMHDIRASGWNSIDFDLMKKK